MDNIWERSIAFYNISIKEAQSIFGEYDRSLEVKGLIPINVGCRNSNYKADTNKGPYLMRICPLNEKGYKKEKTVSGLLHGHIKMPGLLYVSENNAAQRVCLIYEYVNGISMQEILAQEGRLDGSIVEQVAESAAYIHSCDIANNGEFSTLDDYPPFFSWYDLFLDEAAAAERIGDDIKGRIKRLVSDKKDELAEIEKYISFIHCDFRPANMLVDRNNDVWIVDWESCGFGHSLADVGQFFRYSDCFTPMQVKAFETAYNRVSKRRLPSNWYELGKLRDLINPLQMIGAEEELPRKFRDLKNIIVETLGLFGY